MLEHPEIGWAERTGYPSWMQERKGIRRPARNQEMDQKGATTMSANVTQLSAIESLLTQRLEQMAAGTNGIKFDSQEFKRNVSSLKEVKEMIREGEAAQPRERITVTLEGDAEAFAL